MGAASGWLFGEREMKSVQTGAGVSARGPNCVGGSCGVRPVVLPRSSQTVTPRAMTAAGLIAVSACPVRRSSRSPRVRAHRH